MKLFTDSIALFFIVGIRYFVVSGAFYLYFYHWRKSQWIHRKIYPSFPRSEQMKKEIAWSMGTTFFFAVIGAVFYWAFENGYTQLYLEVAPYGWCYLPISLGLVLFLHDAYFYVIHRLMHHRWFFVKFHKIHHESRDPSPFASFSFHPLESFLEAIVVPALACLVPLHWTVYLIFLLIMTISGVVNHLGFEIFPRNANRHWLLKWLINPTHHELHHLRVHGNYGLYFTWWDKIFKTESPQYSSTFDEVTYRESPAWSQSH